MKTVWTDNKWIWDGSPDMVHVLRIFISGLHEGTEETGWETLPDIDDTDNWIGLNVDEVRDLYFGLGVMLSEYDNLEEPDETEFSES